MPLRTAHSLTPPFFSIKYSRLNKKSKQIAPGNVLIMDPLSIIAGTVAVLQAADRLTVLLGTFRHYRNAPTDAAAILEEVERTKSALEEFQTAMSTLPYRDVRYIQQSTAAGVIQLSKLERIIRNISMPATPTNENVSLKINRMAWVRNKSRVDHLKTQLRDTLSIIQLQISFVTL
ncbi:hypothetical protein V2W45_1447235 [Cenococcum geophilum]